MRNAAAAVVAALVCGLATVGQPHAPAATAATAPTAATLRVASFNIQSVSLDRTQGNQRPWKERRAAVIADILGEKVDVLGVQEANQSAVYTTSYATGTTQYEDLRNGLNKAGGHYSLTNPAPYNCEQASTTYRCVYRNRQASGSDRILYDNTKLTLVRQGATEYATQGSSDLRYVVWAVLKIRSTGREVLVASTHLATGPVSARRAQWQQLISRVNQLKGNRPVVVLGDFNTHRLDPLSGRMLPAMRSAGYGDVLNQVYGERTIRRPRARTSINGWINTYNHLDRSVANWSYESDRHLAGYNIDYVFASNTVPVLQWKVVVDYDPTTLRVRGTFPSDHNMVRATLSIR